MSGCWDVSLALSNGCRHRRALEIQQAPISIRARPEAAAVPEPAQRAAQQRFYLQPADNRVEIDRSCRQQVTPCLSAPNGSSCHYSLDRSSLTLSGSAQDSRGCYSSPPRFYLCHLYPNALPLPLAELLPIPSSENHPGPPRVTHLLYPSVAGQTLILQHHAVPGVNTEHAWTTCPLFYFSVSLKLNSEQAPIKVIKICRKLRTHKSSLWAQIPSWNAPLRSQHNLPNQVTYSSLPT